MPHYCVYGVGRDGHFQGAVYFEASDDAEAVLRLEKVPGPLATELWQEARLVKKFPADLSPERSKFDG